MPAKPKESKSDRAKQLIVDALREYDVTSTASWGDVAALSSRTILDSIDVDPDGVIVDGKKFKGIINIYVALAYDGLDKHDAFETSDAFPAKFEGHFEPDDTPVVDQVSIDTSSFYE